MLGLRDYLAPGIDECNKYYLLGTMYPIFIQNLHLLIHRLAKQV